MTEEVAVRNYTLGLDLGSASIGWALIGLDAEYSPCSLLHTGVRIFEPGVEGSIENGQDESKALARRTARLQRRQLRRRAARQRELFRLLQAEGLMPANDPVIEDYSLQRHAILNQLDKELLKEHTARQTSAEVVQSEQLLPYVLRKEALDRKLEAHELGRVLYHLCQRRGFKSNRREGGGKDKEEELGKVKQGISELSQAIVTSGSRTLGEYFAGLDPHLYRIRKRWTARNMFEDEFAKLWERQAAFYPERLTELLKGKIAKLLYFQRPIAKQEHLIGHCELEKKERRAPMASLEAQRFRLLQKVNDLTIIPAGSFNEEKLTAEQRQTVLDLLETQGRAEFTKLRKLLDLPRLTHFNLERGGEKSLPGNRTNAHMLAVFGETWRELAPEEKNKIVELWRSEESEEKLSQEGQERWALDEQAAKLFAKVQTEDKYCNLSLKAIRRILPLMEQGVAFATAREQFYPAKPAEPCERIPLVRNVITELRNPAVERALTEVRKVVNAVVREYGKPYEIRIEMARELRKSRKEREETSKRIRQREKERAAIKARILSEAGLQNPFRTDIEKALLHEECGGVCPYTGKSIEFSSLFGGESQFDIEHIIPLSRCPDDSFLNKTLCYHEENRNVKRGRTPWEAYGSDEQNWNAIIHRVRSWKPGNAAKLRRFELKTFEELQGFTERQMNDTRYTTRLAVDLLKTLYGGLDVPRGDGSNRRVIFATTGMVTATLRKVWHLEGILREAVPSANGENKGKPRTDHRHHAVDAIAIALSSPREVQLMSVYASQSSSWEAGARAFRGLQAPWPDFVDSIRPHILDMRVSHRPEHKMSGALHDETNYGRQRIEGKKKYVHIRKAVVSLSVKDVENIVDPAIRLAVLNKQNALGGDLKRCETANDWPVLIAKDGHKIPIRKARIRKSLEITPIARGPRERFVALSNNHHVAILAHVNDKGKEDRWEGIITSLFEATQRQKQGLPVIPRSYPNAEDYVFKFSLMGGDLVELHRDCDHAANKCEPQIYRLRAIESVGSYSFVKVNDARLVKDINASKERWRPSANTLRTLDCRKVTIDLLGRVHPVND